MDNDFEKRYEEAKKQYDEATNSIRALFNEALTYYHIAKTTDPVEAEQALARLEKLYNTYHHRLTPKQISEFDEIKAKKIVAPETIEGNPSESEDEL
jgi:hypothetical protein